jgi:hypothetical protein
LSTLFVDGAVIGFCFEQAAAYAHADISASVCIPTNMRSRGLKIRHGFAMQQIGV